MYPQKLKDLFIFISILLTHLSGELYAQNKAVKEHQSTQTYAITNIKEDSISLAAFIRNLYRWHKSQIMLDKGFDPKKDHPGDTFYKGIDFAAVNFMISKLRASGYFNESFLENYRGIALRMDRELRKGTSIWREGALPPFNGTEDPWCNCGDSSVKYWPEIKLSMPRFSKDEASFNLNPGGNISYRAKAKKTKGSWQITYMEGFDPSHYKWAK